MKKILTVALTIMCIAFAMVLSSCDDESNEVTYPETMEYTVTLKDYFGNIPSKALYVEFYNQAGDFIEIISAENGVAKATLSTDYYTAVISSADGEVNYDKSKCALAPASPSSEVTIYETVQGERTIYVPKDGENGFDTVEDCHAEIVNEGATLVNVNGRRFYIFTPKQSGVYKISYSSNVAVELAYHGDANIVQKFNLAEVKDGAFEVSVKEGSLGSDAGGSFQMVIALTTEVESSVALIIERTGDVKPDIPYTEKLPTQLSNGEYAYNVGNYTIVDLSVTDKNLKIIYNEDDGYYHVGYKNGPIVYIRLASASKYLASFKTILETSPLRCVEYDEDGNVTLKEDYNQFFTAYIDKCDEAGICPLNDELIYVMKKLGNYMGWYKGSNTIFKNVTVGPSDDVIETPILGVVEENAWMFACCILEQSCGTKDKPLNLPLSETDKDGNIITTNLLLENGISEYVSTRVGATLKIENAQGVKVIFVKKITQTTEGGVITESYEVTTYVPNENNVIEIELTNNENSFQILYEASVGEKNQKTIKIAYEN